MKNNLIVLFRDADAKENKRFVPLKKVLTVIDEWLKSDDVFVTYGKGGGAVPNGWIDCKKGALLFRMAKVIEAAQPSSGNEGEEAKYPKDLSEEDGRDFELLEQYDMRKSLQKTIHYVLTRVPEDNKEKFLVNYCNSLLGSAILHFNNRHVKKLIVPDFKTTFK